MNIILYVFDALRPDFLRCYGYDKNTSPNIDALAEDGVLYENAYATATWTKASAGTIITSQHPRSINMMHQMDKLPNRNNTLPEILNKNGFETHGISANAFFSPEFGFLDFDYFTTLQKDKELLEKRQKTKDPNETGEKVLEKLGIDKLVMVHSEDINNKLFPLLEKGGNKFFMIWSADTHGPYYVRGNKSYFGNSSNDFILEKEVKKENLEKIKSLYCDMIRYNDYHLGELISKLKKEGLYEDSLIIVVADHGDSFGDHTSILGRPIIGHAGIVYEEVIKVPLIIKYPQNKFAGQRCEQLVQLTDIYPTILELCGLEPKNIQMEGISLLPSSGEMSDERTIFVESQVTPEGIYSAAIRKGDHKLIKVEPNVSVNPYWKKLAMSILYKIQVPSIHLYDLASDPRENINLSRQRKEIVDRFLEYYNKMKDLCNKRSQGIEKRKTEIDEEMKSRLKFLGYFD